MIGTENEVNPMVVAKSVAKKFGVGEKDVIVEWPYSLPKIIQDGQDTKKYEKVIGFTILT
jgi:hypothetical protein